MDLLSMVEKSTNVGVSKRLSPEHLDADTNTQYNQYVTEIGDNKKYVEEGSANNNVKVLNSTNGLSKQTAYNDYVENTNVPLVPKGRNPKLPLINDDDVSNENTEWVVKQRNKTFEKNNLDKIAYKERAHVNTNLKMLGTFFPNPLMLAEGASSVAGELVSGAQQMLTVQGMEMLKGVGGNGASVAASWLEWTCPSSPYICPPGTSFIWNTISSALSVLPMAQPSDKSLASSIATAPGKILGYAENWNTGYNRDLIMKHKVPQGEQNKLYLKNDYYNGRRDIESQMGEQIYRYLRRKGNDLTGTVLLEKRAYGDGDTTYGYDYTGDNYDNFTFQEFTFPLETTPGRHFRGAMENINLDIGQGLTLDFCIVRPAGSPVPNFTYMSNREEKDMSYISDISSMDALSILGWEESNAAVGNGGINQGPWGIFNTYRNINKRPQKITFTTYETEDYDVYKWMRKYYEWYYYKDNQSKSLGSGDTYANNFEHEGIHRSPYESFYYLHMMLTTPFNVINKFSENPNNHFSEYLFIVVPHFSFTFGKEDYANKHLQSYTITWEIIGQCQTMGDESQAQSTQPKITGSSYGLADGMSTVPSNEAAGWKIPDANISGDNATTDTQFVSNSITGLLSNK